MSKKILTVIVPSYNTYQYIDECLPTYVSPFLEEYVDVLLIDDGANEETVKMLKEYEQQYPKLFKYIHKENGGHGSVINLGVHKYTKTKYFKVVDGDDWINTNELIKLCEILQSCDADLIVCDYFEVYDSNHIYRKSGLYSENKESYSISDFLLCLPTITYKTSLFIENDILMREHVFYEDNEYDFFPLEYIRTFVYIPLGIYNYRLGNVSQSVSISSRLKHKDDMNLVEKDLCDKYLSLKTRNINPEILSIFEKSLLYFFINDFIYAVSVSKTKKELLEMVFDLETKRNNFESIFKKMDKNIKYRIIKRARIIPFRILKRLLNGRFS